MTQSTKQSSYETMACGSLPQRKNSLSSNVFGNFSYSEQKNQTLCFGFLYLKSKLDIDDIRSRVLKKVINKFPRTRSLLRLSPPQKTFFEERLGEDVDLDYHVQLKFQDLQACPLSLVLEFIGRQYPVKMAKTRPLWRMYYVPNLEDGRSVLILQFDHSIADGTGLREILYSIMDEPEKEMTELSYVRSTKRVSPPGASLMRRIAIMIAGCVGGLILPLQPEDDDNKLKVKDIQNVSNIKKLAPTDIIPLDEVKKIKNALEFATVNDILVTVYALTLKAYFTELERENPDKYKMRKDALVRTSFPIDMRALGDDTSVLRNYISFDRFQIPLNYDDKIDTFWDIKRQLDGCKISPASVVSLRAFQFIAFLPMDWLLKIALMCVGKTTATISNVIGPQVPCYLLGTEVDNMEFYVESEIGLYFGIGSYNGKCIGTISVDGACEPEPERIVRHWKEQFEAFRDRVLEEKESQQVVVLSPTYLKLIFGHVLNPLITRFVGYTFSQS